MLTRRKPGRTAIWSGIDKLIEELPSYVSFCNLLDAARFA